MRCADTGALARGNFRAVSSNFEIDQFCDFHILLLFDLNLAALCAAGLTCAAVSQEIVENDLQTDPENHLHQPHLNTPIITLSPPHSDE